MEQIDHVNINKTTGIVTVGGGTVYEQVINATYAAGREMSTSYHSGCQILHIIHELIRTQLSALAHALASLEPVLVVVMADYKDFTA